MKSGSYDQHEPLAEALACRENRKVRARRRQRHSAWFGLGMFGLVGWAVATPMLLGVALGLAIDARHPGRYSWTLMLLLSGLLVGCSNAWYWISRHRQAITEELREEGSDNSDDNPDDTTDGRQDRNRDKEVIS